MEVTSRRSPLANVMTYALADEVYPVCQCEKPVAERRAIEPPGNGSTAAAVQLRRSGVDTREVSSNPTAPLLHSADFAGWVPRVLVVDDDEISRIAGAGLLSKLGVAADLAVNGQEALEMSARWPYVAIFMDCEMPEVDGYAALTQLHRRESVNVHTPVVAVTSRPQWVSLAAGMDQHIAKPLQMAELRATCLHLGLLASERDPSAVPSCDPGAQAPLLDRGVFGTDAADHRAAKARRAAAFVEQAIARHPEIWRAANAGDAPTLHRLALALKARADAVGTARISVLCDQMGEAAAKSDVAVAVTFEEPLRRAVADTGQPSAPGWTGPSHPMVRRRQGQAHPHPGSHAGPRSWPHQDRFAWCWPMTTRWPETRSPRCSGPPLGSTSWASPTASRPLWRSRPPNNPTSSCSTG